MKSTVSVPLLLYPQLLLTVSFVLRFVELLVKWRQDMIRRCRNRHENAVAAMKKELKAEVKLGHDKYKVNINSYFSVLI